MDEINLIEDIVIAASLLQKGEILITSNGKEKTYFALKDNKVHCQSANATFNLSLRSFMKTYQGSKFIVYTYDDGNSVDLKKDEEYYSWDVLSK